MCFEYEPDRHVRDEQEQEREEIRRLFERYRAASRSEAATKRVAGARAPDTVEEQEPALASRRACAKTGGRRSRRPPASCRSSMRN